MDLKVLMSFVCLVCAVTVIRGEDCNPEVEKLLPLVTKDDVTQDDCDTARIGIQNALSTCTSSDPVGYVKLSFRFSRAFREVGQKCHGTQGPYPQCHMVPKCYNFVSKWSDSGEMIYDCGEDRVNSDKLLSCLTTQINAGCVPIAEKLKSYHEAAIEHFCPKSSALSSAPAVLVLIGALLMSNLFL